MESVREGQRAGKVERVGAVLPPTLEQGTTQLMGMHGTLYYKLSECSCDFFVLSFPFKKNPQNSLK